MHAIVTVIGQDRVGIISAVASCLAQRHVNILDISQTVLQGNFTMVMTVDLSGCGEGFAAVKQALTTLGETMDISIRIQRSEIFEAMHTI